MRGARGALVCSVLVGALLAFLPVTPAEASFPGGNGVLVDELFVDQDNYRLVGYDPDTGARTTIIGWPGRSQDAAWSPDGTRISFKSDRRWLEATGTGYRTDLWVADADGSNASLIVPESSLSSTGGNVRCSAWSPSGDQIAFVGQVSTNNNLYVVNADGTGLRLRRRGTTCPIEWAAGGQDMLLRSIGFQCGCGVSGPAMWDLATGDLTQVPGRDHTLSPDGSKLAYVDDVYTLHEGRWVVDREIFAIDLDGSTAVQLTHTSTSPGDDETVAFPVWSPDSSEVWFSAYIGGAWSMHAVGSGGGAHRSTPLPRSSSFGYAWQPITDDLTVHLTDGAPVDGHSRPLSGATLELFDDGQPVDIEPIERSRGRYAFRDLGPGEYVLRVTLSDSKHDPPAFDVRFFDAAEPTWLSYDVEVPPGDEPVRVDLAFSDEVPYIDSNVSIFHANQAAIFANLTTFADWADATLSPNLGPATVPVVTYAADDPVTGEDVEPGDAYFRPADRMIVLGVGSSSWTARNGGPADEGPENIEWHEFGHHLFYENIWTGAGCSDDFVNHAGWKNPDTCDSMNEGVAIYLAAAAGRDLMGDTTYANFGIDLDQNLAAWHRTTGGIEWEDFALATLLWDLDDATEDVATRAWYREIPGGSILSEVAWTDTVSYGPRGLWALLSAEAPQTVDDLHRILLVAPSRDVDGDGEADVSKLDEPFLMHGFYPVPVDLQGDPGQDPGDPRPSYDYDLDIATPLGLLQANGAIGRTDHEDADGAGPAEQLVPRSSAEIDPGERLEVHAQAGARPLSGVTLEIAVAGESPFIDRRVIDSGDDVPFAAPAFHHGRLPDGGVLPACGGPREHASTLTLTASVNGHSSPDVFELDGCEYAHAVASGVPPALTFSFPEDVAPPSVEASAYSAEEGQPAGDARWSRARWRVDVSCTDGTESGFASGCVGPEVRVDGGEWAPLTAPLMIDEAGVHVVEYRAADRAGNVSEVGSLTLGIDRDAPEADVLLGPPPLGVSAVPVTVLITASDAASGVGSVCVELTATDGSATCHAASTVGLDPSLFSATFTVSPGTYSTAVVVTDFAGNAIRSPTGDMTIV